MRHFLRHLQLVAVLISCLGKDTLYRVRLGGSRLYPKGHCGCGKVVSEHSCLCLRRLMLISATTLETVHEHQDVSFSVSVCKLGKPCPSPRLRLLHPKDEMPKLRQRVNQALAMHGLA